MKANYYQFTIAPVKELSERHTCWLHSISSLKAAYHDSAEALSHANLSVILMVMEQVLCFHQTAIQEHVYALSGHLHFCKSNLSCVWSVNPNCSILLLKTNCSSIGYITAVCTLISHSELSEVSAITAGQGPWCKQSDSENDALCYP